MERIAQYFNKCIIFHTINEVFDIFLILRNNSMCEGYDRCPYFSPRNYDVKIYCDRYSRDIINSHMIVIRSNTQFKWGRKDYGDYFILDKVDAQEVIDTYYDTNRISE